MLKRFLFLAILIIAASPRDVIAEEPEDVFGFRWKMSYAEAGKMASGRMKKDRKSSHFGRTEYKIENPKEPSGAESINLSFFNNELYSMNIIFWIKSDYDFKKKMNGIVEALESKHLDAEMSESINGSYVWSFSYLGETGVTENSYNLEKITVLGSGGLLGNKMLMVFYNFYGAKEINAHIKKLKDEKEFGDF